MSYFHVNGSDPGISTWVRDWTGDGQGYLTLKSRRVSTFLLLLKLKGFEAAAWPWLYPVPELLATALKEEQDGEDRVRLSIRHSFCLKARASVCTLVRFCGLH